MAVAGNMNRATRACRVLLFGDSLVAGFHDGGATFHPMGKALGRALVKKSGGKSRKGAKKKGALPRVGDGGTATLCFLARRPAAAAPACSTAGAGAGGAAWRALRRPRAAAAARDALAPKKA